MKTFTLFAAALMLSLVSTSQAADPAGAPASGDKPTVTTVTEGDEAKPAEDDGRLEPGVIASFGKHPRRASVSTTGSSSPGDKPNPLMARIVRKGTEQCEVTITNTSKSDSYSASFDVIGNDAKGNVAMRKSVSASLSPGGSTSRSVSCRKDLNMEVVLKSGTRR